VRERTLDSKDFALLAARIADDKKAQDIVVIDVAEMLAVIGYFVICTGNSVPQVKMLAEEIEAGLKKAGLPVIGREGVTEAKWILLDCGDVVIHVMQPEQREFYRLEKLWGEAPRVSLPSDAPGAAKDAAKDSDES